MSAAKNGAPLSLDSFQGFRPAAVTFLRGLKRNNKREWFEANRDKYENEIKRPLALLVEEIDARLGIVAPEIVGDPKRSIFRIHRDVRFSKDKSPYKTQAAVWFRHRDAGHTVGTQAVHGGAGFYFEIGPTESYVAGGIWMPPTDALRQIRLAMDDDHESLTRILHDRAFKKTFTSLSTEAVLTRVPNGFDPEHPAAELLKYKSFTVSRKLTTAEAMSARLPDIAAKHYATMLPFVRWLNRALGLSPATRR